MAPRDCVSSFSSTPPPHLLSSAQFCQAMGLGKEKQVEERGDQGLAWCDVSLTVPPCPLIKQGACTRRNQTPPYPIAPPNPS